MGGKVSALISFLPKAIINLAYNWPPNAYFLIIEILRMGIPPTVDILVIKYGCRDIIKYLASMRTSDTRSSVSTFASNCRSISWIKIHIHKSHATLGLAVNCRRLTPESMARRRTNIESAENAAQICTDGDLGDDQDDMRSWEPRDLR